MNLHHDVKLFSDTLRAASQQMDINLVFIEKDYWITLLLSRLAESNYIEETVFKGGTSLSKGYNLIERFSEDVDLAIVNNGGKSGNEIKTIIRKIEKEITKELTEIPTEGITSKGSRFRKSVFEYITTEKHNANNKLIVEINSFANPFPFQERIIKSMVGDYLAQSGNEKYIKQYQLDPIKVNVLSKEQTMLEKLVALVRFSFDVNPSVSISEKIRHFYDLYFLSKHPECQEFIASDLFKKQFISLLKHDREIFDEPKGWKEKSISKSPLITDFPTLWKKIKTQYQAELSALAYRPIPDEKVVAKAFVDLIKRIG
ncbi:MAG: nucleotidyl transferase AbiEii/AbiGii toxin family protein [Chitinophagales bacterium]